MKQRQRAIRTSKKNDTPLHGLMNMRNRTWGLINGQLAEFDTNGKLKRFVKFKVGQ